MRSICICREKKDADRDIPILKQVKAEYAKLQQSSPNLFVRLAAIVCLKEQEVSDSPVRVSRNAV